MTWHLHLKGHSQPSLAQRYIHSALEKQTKKQETSTILDWVNNNSEFNVQESIQFWEETRKRYGDLFLRECLKSYALGNALLDVNNIRSKQLGMEGEGFNTEYFNGIIDKLFAINISNVIVESSSLPHTQKADILARLIARHFPNKENKGLPNPIETLKNQVETFVSQSEPIDTGA